MLDIAIIGGGISGLTTAYFAQYHRKSHILLEESNRIGGVISSEKIDNYIVEKSANSLLYSQNFKELITHLELEKDIVFSKDCAKKRLIFYNNSLQPIPTSPVAISTSSLLNIKQKIKLVHGLCFQSSLAEEQSIYAFFKHYFGEHFTQLFVDAMVSGIWAGDIHKLSMDACFPSLKTNTLKYRTFLQAVKNMQKHQSKIFSFQYGNSTLTNALEKYCASAIHKNEPAQSILYHTNKQCFQIQTPHTTYYSKKIILCIPVYKIPELFKQSLDTNAYQKLLQLCQSISYTPLHLVYSAYNNKEIGDYAMNQLNNFGFLVPRNQHKKILGTIFSSSIFPNRCPPNQTLLTTFIGGEHYKNIDNLNHSKLYTIVHKELAEILQIQTQPIWQHHIGWKRAVPQYHIGHHNIINNIQKS